MQETTSHEPVSSHYQRAILAGLQSKAHVFAGLFPAENHPEAVRDAIRNRKARNRAAARRARMSRRINRHR